MFLFLFILTGCFSDPVQDDLLNYVNEELPRASQLEAEAVSAYQSVTGANYTDDYTLYDVLSLEVIPTYNEFIKELESIHMETDEVNELHEEYIEAANIQYNAFVKTLTAIENQDRQIIEEANSMLEEARSKIRNYNTELKKLAKEHNVELEQEDIVDWNYYVSKP